LDKGHIDARRKKLASSEVDYATAGTRNEFAFFDDHRCVAKNALNVRNLLCRCIAMQRRWRLAR
jgi:hypothetical protein